VSALCDTRAGNNAPCATTRPQTWSLKQSVAGGAKGATDGLGPINLTGDLTAVVSLTARFEKVDSSISGRMACKSSVAETAGNNSSKAQPRISGLRREPQRSVAQNGTVLRRHIQIAGSASDSQSMLRNSSILAKVSVWVAG
jgi:hypothetical protein